MFTVTRQIQHPDGAHVVEVSRGDINYANPDALTAKYAGEFKKFADPREAVQTAIEIARQWRKDSRKRIAIGVGATGGMTMPFDVITQRDAVTWANELWDRLPKCGGCTIPYRITHANAPISCATRAAEFEASSKRS